MTILATSDLITAGQAWLFNRSDLAATFPTFVQFFEAKMNRTLFHRKMENIVTATLNAASSTPQIVALPTDFQTMRRVRIINTYTPDNGTSTQITKLRYATGASMADLQEENPNPGTPIWFSLYASAMELCPFPDQNYEIEMVYRQNLPPLASNTTNWLLADAPDAYLYGSLMEAGLFLSDDDRVPIWQGQATKALAELNALSDKALHDAGPLTQHRVGARRGYS